MAHRSASRVQLLMRHRPPLDCEPRFRRSIRRLEHFVAEPCGVDAALCEELADRHRDRDGEGGKHRWPRTVQRGVLPPRSSSSGATGPGWPTVGRTAPIGWGWPTSRYSTRQAGLVRPNLLVVFASQISTATSREQSCGPWFVGPYARGFRNSSRSPPQARASYMDNSDYP
jgi:hypothetical protein